MVIRVKLNVIKVNLKGDFKVNLNKKEQVKKSKSLIT